MDQKMTIKKYTVNTPNLQKLARKSTETGTWVQYASAVSSTLLSFLMGCVLGWPASVLPQLQNENSTLYLNEFHSSMVVSTQSLTTTVSPLISTLLVDIVGRKNILLASAIPYAISWLLIYFASAIYMLYLSRVVSGVAIGMSLHALPIYLAEISTPKIRGNLSSISIFQWNMGILVGYAVGPFLSVHDTGLVFVSVPFVFLLTFIWMPESPYFLLLRGNEKAAAISLRRLRGKEFPVNDEIERIKVNLSKQKEQKGGLSDLIKIKSNRKAMILCFVIFVGQKWCGYTTFLAYSPFIFSEFGTVQMTPYVCQILFAALGALTLFLGSFLVDNLGRKILLVMSAFSTSFVLLVIGIYLFLKYAGFDVSSYATVPTICFISFPVTYGIGLSFVPYVLIGEMFPTNIKALACLIQMVAASLLIFCNFQGYHIIVTEFGMNYIFCLFALICLLVGFFVVVFLPETKGKTMEEIEIVLTKK